MIISQRPCVVLGHSYSDCVIVSRLCAGPSVAEGRRPFKICQGFAVTLLHADALLIRKPHLIQRVRAVRFGCFAVSLQRFFGIRFHVIPGGVGICPGIARFGGFLVIRQRLCVILRNRYAVLVIMGDHPAGGGVARFRGGQIAFRRAVKVHFFAVQALAAVFAPDIQRAAVALFRRVTNGGQRFKVLFPVKAVAARLKCGH